MLQDFDVDALALWQKLSKWLHARTYSERIELTTIGLDPSRIGPLAYIHFWNDIGGLFPW